MSQYKFLIVLLKITNKVDEIYSSKKQLHFLYYSTVHLREFNFTIQKQNVEHLIETSENF